jgi:hypothetical protein
MCYDKSRAPQMNIRTCHLLTGPFSKLAAAMRARIWEFYQVKNISFSYMLRIEKNETICKDQVSKVTHSRAVVVKNRSPFLNLTVTMLICVATACVCVYYIISNADSSHVKRLIFPLPTCNVRYSCRL